MPVMDLSEHIKEWGDKKTVEPCVDKIMIIITKLWNFKPGFNNGNNMADVTLELS